MQRREVKLKGSRWVLGRRSMDNPLKWRCLKTKKCVCSPSWKTCVTKSQAKKSNGTPGWRTWPQFSTVRSRFAPTFKEKLNRRKRCSLKGRSNSQSSSRPWNSKVAWPRHHLTTWIITLSRHWPTPGISLRIWLPSCAVWRPLRRKWSGNALICHTNRIKPFKRPTRLTKT